MPRSPSSTIPGRVFEASSGRASAVDQGSGLHDAVRQAFAAELSAALAQHAGADERCGIVAPARFLALLRGAMPRGIADRVAVELDADLTRLPRRELFERLDRLAREAGHSAR
jgi:protein required for attachment to host cells